MGLKLMARRCSGNLLHSNKFSPKKTDAVHSLDLQLQEFAKMEIFPVTSCEPICSSNFTCDWSRWDYPFQYKFPDGTFQTCVGTQVRCGCTFSMKLASFFTYEHPSIITITWLSICLLVILFVLRCLILGVCGNEPMLLFPVFKKQPIPCDHENDYGEENSFAARSRPSQQFETRVQSSPVPFMVEPPPTYSSLFNYHLDDPPPQYSESMKHL